MAGLTATLAIGFVNLRVEINPDEQLPQSHPYVAAFREVHRLFGDKDLLIIALAPTRGDIGDPTFLRAVRDITDQISNIPGCVRPLLRGLGSPATKDIRLAPDGLRVEPLLSAIPESPFELSALRSRILGDSTLRGTLVSNDGGAIAIYATFEPTPELPGYVNIIDRVNAILKPFAGNILSYNMSGPVAIVAGLTTYAARALSLFPLSLFIIAILHFEAYRTWQAVFLPLLTGLLGVTWAVGLMGLLHVPLDPFISTTPVLILAIGTGHAVQILTRYYEQLRITPEPKDAIVEALVHTGSAMIASSLIAALSFLSLTTLGTASMRRFGLFTALGIIATLLIEITLIPAIRALSSSRTRPRSTNGPGVASSLRLATHTLSTWTSRPRLAKVVLYFYGVLALICTTLAMHVTTDSSFVRQFQQENPVRRQDAFVNSRFAGSNVLIFIISAPTETSLATPSAINAIDHFERAIETLPNVGKVTSLTDTLKRIHHVLMPARTSELPDTADLLTQYLFLYSLSGGDELSTMITPDYRSMKIVALLREDSTSQGAITIAHARALADEILPPDYQLKIAGTIASNIALNEVMVRGKLLNVGQIIMVTSLISAMVLRSVLGGLLVTLPLALAVLVNFGSMALLRIPLDVATSAVSAMAVGIGADYAIYFLFRLREEIRASGDLGSAIVRTTDTAGSTILFVASAVGCGYAVLCFAGYQLYVSLGLLLVLAMATTSLASMTVVPAVITLLVNNGVTPSFLSADVSEVAKLVHGDDRTETQGEAIDSAPV